jgi:hypothetical protein
MTFEVANWIKGRKPKKELDHKSWITKVRRNK